MRRLRVGRPQSHDGTLVLPVEAVFIDHAARAGRVFAWVRLEPHAVVVSTPRGTRAWDVGGEEIPLTSLLREVPDLRSALSDF